MTELLQKLENCYVEEPKKIEEFANEIFNGILPQIIEKPLQEEMNQIKQLFKELSFSIEASSVGMFSTVINITQLKFHFELKVYEQTLCIYSEYGTGMDIISKQFLCKEFDLSKKEKREEFKELVTSFIQGEKETLDFHMEKIIESAYEFLTTFVLNGKHKMTIKEYISWSSRIKSETYMPMVPIYEQGWDENTLELLLENAKNKEWKQKLLFSFIPMLHERWHQNNRLFGLFTDKSKAEKLKLFIEKHYTKEVFEIVIKGRETNKLISRAYGVHMKTLVKENATYKELVVFLDKVMNEKKYNVRINNSETVKLIDDFDISTFNSTFLVFGLNKRDNKDSSHCLFYFPGYDAKKKNKADSVTGFLQILNFYNEKEHVKKRALFLTGEIIEEWLEIIKENVYDFL